jgi:hypothetical protein
MEGNAKEVAKSELVASTFWSADSSPKISNGRIGCNPGLRSQFFTDYRLRIPIFSVSRTISNSD